MQDLIQIDFNIVQYMIIGFFGLVGFFRGWWKEGFSTFFLSLLLLMLKRPAFAEKFITIVNSILKALYNLVRDQLASTFSASAAVTTPPNVDPRTYQIYLITLIVLVITSYLIGRTAIGKNTVTPLGQVLGATLGILNGFVAISLIREYILQRFLPGAAFATAQETAGPPPSTFSIQFVDIPPWSIADGLLPWFIIAVGGVVMLAVIATGWDPKKKLKRTTPPGYKAPPEPPKKKQTITIEG